MTSGQVWRATWWQYYERALSYAEGECWDEAIVSFQAALATKLGHRDQRRANTYGLHFIDNYFPHRELAVLYYRRGQYKDALKELETSFAHVETAKAKFYLNKIRKALLQRSRLDTAPPRIRLDAPTNTLLTNRFMLEVRGQVEDDTYVSAIMINGRPLLIELAEPRLVFTENVTLHDGPNVIDIVAEDLLGRRTHKRVTVQLDRHGPLLSLERAELRDTHPHPHAHVQGFISDRSRITRFILAGKRVPLQLQVGAEWAFQREVRVAAGTPSLPFEAEDAAGNVTRGAIALGSFERGPRKARQGQSVPSLLARRVSLHAGMVDVDRVVPASAPLRMVRHHDPDPPQITLSGLEDRAIVYDNKVYLEGKVTDDSDILTFSIAGEPNWKHKCKQLFFGYLALLRAGEPNRFLLEATDEWNNRTERPIHVTYTEPPPRQLDARLRVLLMPFATPEQPTSLAETIHHSLLDALVEQRRFDVIDQALAVRQQALVEPAEVVKVGKALGVDGILMVTVIEAIKLPGETAKLKVLNVYARFVDVDTKEVVVAEDIYSEVLTPADVKTLMAGLALKLQRHFPLVEGTVIAKEGETLWIDLSGDHSLQKDMKLIVFREGKKIEHGGRILQRPPSTLGEARLTVVSKRPDVLSEARLLSGTESKNIGASDKVIAK